MPKQETKEFYRLFFQKFGIAEIALLLPIVEMRRINSGSVYIDEGSANKKLAFIKKGLIRAFRLDAEGGEKTIMLRWENQFIASVDTVLMSRPSRFIYQALEDTEVAEVDYDKLKKIMDNNFVISGIQNEFLLNMLMEALDRIESFILLSPTARYQKLVQEKPDILNRVPGKYLASMLGITPVSLSRVRARIASQKKR